MLVFLGLKAFSDISVNWRSISCCRGNVYDRLLSELVRKYERSLPIFRYLCRGKRYLVCLVKQGFLCYYPS